MKKIWVPKKCFESLQVNVLMTPPVKNRNPRSNSSYGSNSSNGSKSSYDYHHANNSVSQGRAKGYEYVHYSSNHYVHKSSKNFSAYSYANPDKLDGSTGGPFAATHEVLGYCSGFQYVPSALSFLSKAIPSFLGFLLRIFFLSTSQRA